jgi:hypothetical protein
MPIFRGRKPTKKKSFGGKPGKPGRGGKPGGKFGKFSKPGGGAAGGGAGAGGKKGKKRAPKRKKKVVKKAPAPSLESTGMEALYLKELMDAETPVIVVLNTGEKVRGFVRYYDQEVFSLGPADGSPKMFLRKEGIRYLYEEPDEDEEYEEEYEDEEEDDEEYEEEERE